MIILDTNVVSDLMKPNPYGPVFEWAFQKADQSLFTTAITEAEIRYGIAILPDGRRQRELLDETNEMFAVDFLDRLLDFDGNAARAYALIASERRKSGRPISQSDAQIAGITRSRGATLATRNTRDFENRGIDLIDPWSA